MVIYTYTSLELLIYNIIHLKHLNTFTFINYDYNNKLLHYLKVYIHKN